MYTETLRQAWVEIDTSALENNLREIKSVLQDQDIIAVIKADAYGHGAVELARVLKKNGVTHFAVATIEEALELRDNGIEDSILILGFVPSDCSEIIVRNKLTPVIGRIHAAEALSDAAVKLGQADYGFLFAIDTGMGRIGYTVMTDDERREALTSYKEMDAMPGIKPIGVITHFSTADEEDRSYTEWQISNYEKFIEMLSQNGHKPLRIAANSASIMVHHKALFDAVRPGIILYGQYPSSYLFGKVLNLKPLMTVKASIVNIKIMPVGRSVSYGRKFTSESERVIATIPLGYADGYSRALSGKIEVLVDGVRCPVVGNICMDQCMIDVTDVPSAKLDTEVVVMGKQGDESITADDLAALLGSINYEITCGFGLRLPKVYK